MGLEGKDGGLELGVAARERACATTTTNDKYGRRRGLTLSFSRSLSRSCLRRVSSTEGGSEVSRRVERSAWSMLEPRVREVRGYVRTL